MLTVRWLLAAVHLLGFGFAFASIAARNRALKRVAGSRQAADLSDVFKADAIWGVSALVLIMTGIVRAFGGFEKGGDYYLHAPLFHLKMGALALILVLELVPMTGLIRWRMTARRGMLPELARARVCADRPRAGDARRGDRARGGRDGARRRVLIGDGDGGVRAGARHRAARAAVAAAAASSMPPPRPLMVFASAACFAPARAFSRHTTFFSTIGRPSSTRAKPSGDRSSDVYRPCTISSATPRPVAGPCCSPCPEKPFAKMQLSTAGCGPMIAFWSSTLYS